MLIMANNAVQAIVWSIMHGGCRGRNEAPIESTGDSEVT